MAYLKASQVDLFAKALRKRLLDQDSMLAKSYLNRLVEEIVVENKTATIKGAYDCLAGRLHKIKVGNLNNQVPISMYIWRPQGVLSKSRPLKSPAPAKFFANGSPYEIFINTVNTEAVQRGMAIPLINIRFRASI